MLYDVLLKSKQQNACSIPIAGTGGFNAPVIFTDADAANSNLTASLCAALLHLTMLCSLSLVHGLCVSLKRTFVILLTLNTKHSLSFFIH